MGNLKSIGGWSGGHGLKTRVTGAVLLFMGLLAGGCGAPAPGTQFVEQANRLHREALGAAVNPDADLRDYVQLVGKRVMDAARDVDAGRTRDPLFSAMQFHLVGIDVPNAVTDGGRAHLCVQRLVPALLEVRMSWRRRCRMRLHML